MKKIAFKYGIIGGLIAAAVGYGYYLLGNRDDYSTAEVIGYVSIILSMITVFFGIREYRDKFNHGAMNFKTGMKVGMFISVIAALAFVFWDTIYVTAVNPDFYEEYYVYMKDYMEETDASADEMKTMEEQYTFFKENPSLGLLLSGGVMFVTVFIIGALMSLIASLVMKNNNENPEVQLGT